MTTQLLLAIALTILFGCLLCTTALTPFVMALAHRVGAIDRGGYRKVFQGAMPLLGGLAIAVPVILVAFAIALAGHYIVGNWETLYLRHRESFDFLFSLASIREEFITLALGGIAIVALGMLDDIRGMRARWKLLGQVAVAGYICLSGYTLEVVSLPYIGVVDFGSILGTLLTILWLVGLINAFNLIDGVDGLASGIALIGAVALVALATVQTNEYVAFSGAALIGSLLAFLRYNFPPAKVFLGDTGSMFLGYALATMSLIGSQKTGTAAIVFAPMLALSLPIFETLVSMLRRWVRGAPLFVGDARHTHHRLLSKGYSQPKVVLTLYVAALFLAVAGFMSAVIPENSPWAVCAYVLYAGTLVYLAWLAGYLRPAIVGKMFERRQRNRVFQALGKYAALQINTVGHCDRTALLLELCRRELGLRHVEVLLDNDVRLMVSSDHGNGEWSQAGKEMLTVKASNGQELHVAYVYETVPEITRRQDVAACLACIFEQLKIEPLLQQQEDLLRHSS